MVSTNVNTTLAKHFEKIGARAKLRAGPKPHPVLLYRGHGENRLNDGEFANRNVEMNAENLRRAENMIRVDIRKDRNGEYFDIQLGGKAEVQVLDSQPENRHLLLMRRAVDGAKSKFLCGHDERHWFVAAIPEKAAASNVATAMEALKPEEIRAVQEIEKPKKRNRRKNKAFKRQGEWFFVPVENDKFLRDKVIHKNEPLQRGRAKPHMTEALIRIGGTTVYVSTDYPNGIGLTEMQRIGRQKKLITGSAEAKKFLAGFRTMVRDPEAYARGKVRHPDHATITLGGWHRVYMNTETRAKAMAHVAFLD